MDTFRHVAARLDQKVIVVAMSCFLLTYLVVNKVILARYTSKQVKLVQEDKRLKLAQEVKSMQTRVSRIKKGLFKTSDQGVYISQVNNILKKNEMEVLNIIPQGDTTKRNITTTTLQVSAKGDYSKIQKMLEDIEQSERLIYPAYIDIEAQSDSPETKEEVDNPILLLTMQLLFFAKGK